MDATVRIPTTGPRDYRDVYRMPTQDRVRFWFYSDNDQDRIQYEITQPNVEPLSSLPDHSPCTWAPIDSSKPSLGSRTRDVSSEGASRLIPLRLESAATTTDSRSKARAFLTLPSRKPRRLHH